MPIDRVVVNASPLITLFKSQLADLLASLFQEILVPSAVWEEVLAAGATDVAAQQLPTVAWAKRIEAVALAPEIIAWDLGAGESEVLSLARQHPEYRAVVDDAAARRCARALSIPPRHRWYSRAGQTARRDFCRCSLSRSLAPSRPVVIG